MTSDPEPAWRERPLRRARLVILVSLATTAWCSLVMPGIGLVREPAAGWRVAGAVGIVAVTVAQSGVLYAVVTPWLTDATRRRWRSALAATAVLSVALVGPVATGEWATWAWLGASLIGTLPLVLRRTTALAAAAATLAAGVAVSLLAGAPVWEYALITGGVGASIALVNLLQVWFWGLLLAARQGYAAQARLAAAEERLRFARDVHDLLGHNLSVIAWKAELAARLAATDPARAGAEAAAVRGLAAAALAELREVVHGYQAVDLTAQAAAIADVLRASGVRCTLTGPPGDLPARVATLLVPVLREATTNVLRHSRATWCTIEIGRPEPTDRQEVRMVVRNDGAGPAVPDRHSTGLANLTGRLGEAGGSVRTERGRGTFTLTATLPAAP